MVFLIVVHYIKLFLFSGYRLHLEMQASDKATVSLRAAGSLG